MNSEFDLEEYIRQQFRIEMQKHIDDDVAAYRRELEKVIWGDPESAHKPTGIIKNPILRDTSG